MPPTEQRDLRRLIAAYAVNRTGDFLYTVSLVVHVFAVTGSLTWVAVTSIARLVPAVLLAPLAGVVADRFDRRRVFVTSGLLGGAVMATLAALVAVDAAVGWIPLIAAIGVAVNSPSMPAFTALIAQIVPASQRAAANSMVGTVESAAVAVGPAVGALVLLLGGNWPAFLLNALSFVAAAAILAGIRPVERSSVPATVPRSVSGASVARDLRAGLHAALVPGVRGVVGWTTLTCFLFGVQIVLVAPLSTDRLGTGSWGAGCLEAASGIGGVLAGVWFRRRPATASATSALPLSALLTAAGLALAVLLPVAPLAWLMMGLAGVGMLIVDVAGLTQLMDRVPESAMGRVDGVVSSIALAALVAGNALAAALIDTVGLVGGALWCVLPAAALAAVGLLGRRLPAACASPAEPQPVA